MCGLRVIHEDHGLRELYAILRKQKYHIVGSHSAVKKCNWMHKALVKGEPCYKQKFYGIKSHRCVQMTPAVVFCNFRCVHCWRVQPEDVSIRWNQLRPQRWDDPVRIVEGSIREQRRILSGYKDQVLRRLIPKERYQEALRPRHVAISLSGEPTLYPHLGELIREYHKRGMTTFLVTNGSLPEVIERLDPLPTQLYVTVPASNPELFENVTRPISRGFWTRLMKTLEILPSLSTRTVIRLTLVRGISLRDPEGYAKLINMANPLFVEPKGYVHVGFSQRRLSRDNMPLHEEIKNFAKKLAEETGYHIIDESPPSRVVLLSRQRKVEKFSG